MPSFDISAIISQIPKSCFVTGTGTGVGKTYVATHLIRTLRRQGYRTVGFKPICCGGDEDTQALWEASDKVVPFEQITPVQMKSPVSPYTASQLENTVVDLDRIFQEFSALQKKFESVIVEGAGGWRVPITKDYFMSDLARDLKLPVLVVVADKLGALNETFLTVERMRRDGLVCVGCILNRLPWESEDLAIKTNRRVLEELLEVPCF